MQINGIDAIDTVVNIWTEESLSYRPSWRHEFFSEDAGRPGAVQPVSLERMLDMMDEAGIERGFLVCIKAGRLGHPSTYHLPYELVADAVQKYPDRFHGLAGIDPYRGHGGRARARERGEGATASSARISIRTGSSSRPTTRKYYPFYAKCCELDVPMQMQVGQSMVYAPDYPCRSVGRPITLDARRLRLPGAEARRHPHRHPVDRRDDRDGVEAPERLHRLATRTARNTGRRISSTTSTPTARTRCCSAPTSRCSTSSAPWKRSAASTCGDSGCRSSCATTRRGSTSSRFEDAHGAVRGHQDSRAPPTDPGSHRRPAHRSIDYRTLDRDGERGVLRPRRSRHQTRRFRRRGLGDTAEHLITLLAMARLGAVIVPIDHSWSVTRSSRSRRTSARGTSWSTPARRAQGAPFLPCRRMVRARPTASITTRRSRPSRRCCCRCRRAPPARRRARCVTHQQFENRFMAYWINLGFNRLRPVRRGNAALFRRRPRLHLVDAVLPARRSRCSRRPMHREELIEHVATCAAAPRMFLVPTILRRLIESTVPASPSRPCRS